MGFIAIAFLGSTLGMLIATAWQVVRRMFGRRKGRDSGRTSGYSQRGA